MVLIDFIDNNIKDTLILIRSLTPDKVVLIADKDDDSKLREGMTAFVDEIARLHGKTMRIEIVDVDSRDSAALMEKVRDAARGCAGDVYINLSSVNDLMTACAYHLSTSTDIDPEDTAIPVCVDIKAGIIRLTDTFEELCKIEHLKIDDYLIAIGGKELDGSRDNPDPSEYDDVCMIAEELFKDVYAWNKLCVYISSHYSHQHDKVTIPVDLGEPGAVDETTIRSQLDAFCRGHVLEHVEGDKYRFTSTKHKGWMTVFGVWLEMYIYIKIKTYVDEVRLGLVLDWDANDDYDTKDNELDVVAIKDSRPIVISCKMRMPTKEDIYEVGYIADRIGGRAAKAAIATSAIVDHKETYKPGLYPRFRKMDIGLLETIDIRKGEDEARAEFDKLF